MRYPPTCSHKENHFSTSSLGAISELARKLRHEFEFGSWTTTIDYRRKSYTFENHTYHNSMSQLQSQEDIYLQSYPFTTAASIIGLVDRKVSAVVIGGFVIIGVLRTFDQFGNLVIHNAVERIYFPKRKEYAESDESNTYIIRGENLLMLGDIDIDTEDDEMKSWTKLDNFDEACKLKDDSINKLKNDLVEESEILKQKYPVVNGDFMMRLNAAF